jgi:hypothetical protein
VPQRELLCAPPGTVAAAQPNLYFSVEDTRGGPSLDLCPSGRSRVVTDVNKFEYVDLVVQHCLVKDVEERLGVGALLPRLYTPTPISSSPPPVLTPFFASTTFDLLSSLHPRHPTCLDYLEYD